MIYLFVFISFFTFQINACKKYFSLLFFLLHINLDRGDFMTSVRDGYNRFDPDSTLNGFFPFWGIVLLLISCKSIYLFIIIIYVFVILVIFLLIAGFGLVGYLVGCRSPPESLRQQLDPATFFA
jgi:hypothetical protein